MYLVQKTVENIVRDLQGHLLLEQEKFVELGTVLIWEGAIYQVWVNLGEILGT